MVALTPGGNPMQRRFQAAIVLCLAIHAVAFADDAPKGEVAKYTFDASKIFPGTTRDYWVYVPKRYDAQQPACVFVCQDGIQYKAPDAFDQLIAAGEMPVTIGVFIMHGRVKALSDQALDRFNRSFEYDGLGDAYARFVLE
jgi:enterochelin esterase-like enzyme